MIPEQILDAIKWILIMTGFFLNLGVWVKKIINYFLKTIPPDQIRKAMERDNE